MLGIMNYDRCNVIHRQTFQNATEWPTCEAGYTDRTLLGRGCSGGAWSEIWVAKKVAVNFNKTNQLLENKLAGQQNCQMAVPLSSTLPPLQRWVCQRCSTALPPGEDRGCGSSSLQTLMVRTQKEKRIETIFLKNKTNETRDHFLWLKPQCSTLFPAPPARSRWEQVHRSPQGLPIRGVTVNTTGSK